MIDDLVTTLLPALHSSREATFNVFDVMRHGIHEKQLSNVFAWLLDVAGTHRLGDTFQRIFIAEVNRQTQTGAPFGAGPYLVRQEVNTSKTDAAADIADLVLESKNAVIVVENYITSDGHGHNYCRYLEFGERDGRRGGVVLLCRYRNRALLTDGWEQASVVTYDTLLERLHEAVVRDSAYRRQQPEAFTFIDQMHRKFAQGRALLDDAEVLEFITVMCDIGEASRYGQKPFDDAARRFAADVAEQALARFDDGRVLLQRVKTALKAFCDRTLQHQLNATLGDGFIEEASAHYSGIYQWTINFTIRDDPGYLGEHPLQLKFGPSARCAIADDDNWVRKAAPATADYTHLFITRAATREVRQSSVTLQQVLAGLSGDDRRLHDEICDLLRPETQPGTVLP